MLPYKFYCFHNFLNKFSDDLSLPEHLQSKTDEQVPLTEHISVPVSEMGQTAEPILATESIPLVEPFPAPETTLEKGPHPSTELPAVAQTSHIPPLVEIEPIVPVQEKPEMAKVGRMRKEQRKQFVELQANEIALRTAKVCVQNFFNDSFMILNIIFHRRQILWFWVC